MLKTFIEKDKPHKKFHHLNILGFKFRIADNERKYVKRNTDYNPKNRSVYFTERGLVLNFIKNRYLCIMKS